MYLSLPGVRSAPGTSRCGVTRCGARSRSGSALTNPSRSSRATTPRAGAAPPRLGPAKEPPRKDRCVTPPCARRGPLPPRAPPPPLPPPIRRAGAHGRRAAQAVALRRPGRDDNLSPRNRGVRVRRARALARDGPLSAARGRRRAALGAARRPRVVPHRLHDHDPRGRDSGPDRPARAVRRGATRQARQSRQRDTQARPSPPGASHAAQRL